jgi:hypothetical protein
MGFWNISLAARNIYNFLGLNKKVNALSNASPVALSEARYCFFLCYINDRGLARSLGRPLCIPDTHIEIDLREVSPPATPAVRQAVENYVLELAIVQNYIIDLQLSKETLTSNNLQIRISGILQVLDNIWKMIQNVILSSLHHA